MNLLKNKKGDEVLGEIIIFVILNVLFISMLLYFVWNSSSGANVLEEVYAKKIALIIDNMPENMILEIEISDIANMAEKNGYNGLIVTPVYEKNMIIVRASNGAGYSYHYFSNVLGEGSISENHQTKKLIIKS